MGLIIGLFMVFGFIFGIVITVLAVTFAVVTVSRHAETHSQARPLFWRLFATTLIGALLIVGFYPTEYIRPGNDYDIWARTSVLRAFAFAASPGVSALIALVAVVVRLRGCDRD